MCHFKELPKISPYSYPGTLSPIPLHKIHTASFSWTRNLSYSTDKKQSTTKSRIPLPYLTLIHSLLRNKKLQALDLEVFLWMKDAYVWFRFVFKALAKVSSNQTFIFEVIIQLFHLSQLPPADSVCKEILVYLSYSPFGRIAFQVHSKGTSTTNRLKTMSSGKTNNS